MPKTYSYHRKSRKRSRGQDSADYRRPGAAEYAVIKEIAHQHIDEMMGMLRDLDASLEAAGRAFNSYQIRIDGNITVSFLMERNGVIHPALVRFRVTRSGQYVPMRMTDQDVRQWNVATHWHAGHINVGRYFLDALRATHEVILFRRHILSEITGLRAEKISGLVGNRRRTDSLKKKLAERLDEMTRRQVKDWSAAIPGGDDRA
jgi:hypothetical protein